MDFATIKKMFEDGKLTQEEFDAKCKELGVDKDGNKAVPEISDELKAYINSLVQQASQSSADKVRTEYSLKLKTLEAEKKKLEDEKLASMSEAEKTQFALEQEKLNFEAQKKEFGEQSRKFKATQVLGKMGMLDENMSLLPFAIGETEEEMSKNFEVLKAWNDKSKEAHVAQLYKNAGRNLGGSGETHTADEKEVEFGKEVASRQKQGNEKSEKAMSHYFEEE